jgi:hypothetical protein
MTSKLTSKVTSKVTSLLKSRVIERLSLFVGGLRPMFIPFGLFALLAIGIHVGCNRLDNHLFVLLNVIDAAVDDVLCFIIQKVCALFSASQSTVDLLTYRAIDFIDLEIKSDAARYGALAYELVADVVLALPVFLYREERWTTDGIRERAKAYFEDPTLLKLAGPAAAVSAGIAGVFSISREIEVLAHSLISHVTVQHASGIAGMLGAAALAVVAWRLLAIAVLGAAEYAERRANNDRVMSVPLQQRRLRGLLTAFVALPIALLAVEATPILGSLRALMPR